MVEHQGPRRRAAVKIVVHQLAGRTGEDVTSRLHPYLISVQIIDSLEGGHSECHIELDDRNAELQLPPDLVPIRVYLGWANEGPRIPDRGRFTQEVPGLRDRPFTAADVATATTQAFAMTAISQEQPWGGPGMELLFDGTVTSVESGFGRRGGGRRVWIEASSGNVMGLVKEKINKSFGEGKPVDGQQGQGATSGGKQIPLNEVLQQVFKNTGTIVKLSPEMMKVTRDYWYINESPMDFARAMAQLHGANFQISGNVATIIGKNENVNADGITLPTIEAVWGVNLIGWRIKPYAGRPQWGGTQARYFDLMNATWEKVSGSIGGETPFGGVQAIAHYLHPVADAAVGGDMNKGNKEDSQARRGTGWVLLNGEPRAKAKRRIQIMNARPGVDGVYQMTEVEHNYTRSVGYTTRANVMYPMPTGKWGWTRDPGKFIPREGGEKRTPPLLLPGMQNLPEKEKAILRQWYLDNNEPVPELLKPDPSATPPPQNQRSYTPEELARAQADLENRLGREIGDILNSLEPPQP